MAFSQPNPRGRLRTFVLAMFAATLCVAGGAQAAGAAASMQVTSDNIQAGAPTSLTIKTALTGSGNDLRQYGAAISVPKSLRINYGTYGSTEQMCPGSAFSATSTGFTPTAMDFDVNTCPATALVGSVSLGDASGGIYLVNTTPMPSLGLYFDTGIETPVGRKMEIDYITGAQVLRVNGLPDMESSGLDLNFTNPDRPGGLQTKLWNWAPADTLSDCKPNSNVVGGVYVYPTSGTAATSVTAQPKALKTTGCGVGFKLTTSTNVANAATTLKIETPLLGTGNDKLQYGNTIKLPPVIHPNYYTFGDSSQMCSGSTVQSMNTGYTPGAWSFDAQGCPATAKVGTVKLGTMTGGIYTVNSTPVPSFGVWFDTGVTSSFGRWLSIDWTGSAPGLSVYGLPNSPSTGLVLDFNNTARPTLPAKVWKFSEPGVPSCANGVATSVTSLYPASGTETVSTYPLKKFISVTGC